MSDETDELTRERDYWRGVVRKISDVLHDGSESPHVHDIGRYERIQRLVDDAIAGDC